MSASADEPSARRAIGIDFAAFSFTLHQKTSRRQSRVEASLWTRCMGALEAELPEQQFNTWVRPLQAIEGERRAEAAGAQPLRRRLDQRAPAAAHRRAAARSRAPGDAPIVTVEVGSRAAPLRFGWRGRRGCPQPPAPRRKACRRRAAQSRTSPSPASSRARATSSPRPPRFRWRKTPAAPTTRCSSTAVWGWARRT